MSSAQKKPIKSHFIQIFPWNQQPAAETDAMRAERVNQNIKVAGKYEADQCSDQI